MNDNALVLDNPELTASRIQEQLTDTHGRRDNNQKVVDSLVRSLFSLAKSQLHRHLDDDGRNLATWEMLETARQLHEAQNELNQALRDERELLYLLGL